uniref:histone-lysine N-methyltransferase ASHH2 n=1 Tax=Erigeron canadensis TaxID=72917 RepID=UPI001CB90898|nr:histone-lysine N-methyltransferase ASHH2 [Erigeron canadensis]
MANLDSEILPAEDAHGAPFDFNEFVSSMEPHHSTDTLSIYLESCKPFRVTNPESSNNLDGPNISCTKTLVDDRFNSIVLTECSDLRHNDGEDSSIANEIKRSSTRKSTRKIPSNQITDNKLPMRKSRRTSGRKLTSDLLAADVRRRQRSDLARRARPSAWGFGGKIDEIFKHNAEEYANVNELVESKKGRIVHRGSKRNTDFMNQTIQNSLGESQAINKGLLLKLNLGTMAIQNCQVNTIPDMDKDLEIYREIDIEAPTSQIDIHNKEVSRASHETLVSSKSSVIDMLYAEKERHDDLHVKISSEINEMTGIGESIESRCLDPGTSPDSEVINVMLETQNSGSTTEDILVTAKDCISHPLGDYVVGSGIPSPEIINDVLSEKQIEGSWSNVASMSITNGVTSSNTSSKEGCPMEPLQETKIAVSSDMLAVGSIMQGDITIAGINSLESKSNGQSLQKSSNSKSFLNLKTTNYEQKGLHVKLTSMGEVKEKSGKAQAECDLESHRVTVNFEKNDIRGLEGGSKNTAEPLSNSNIVPSEGDGCQVLPQSAWVCCDDCHKWRRISAILADDIELTKCRWICKDNKDKTFADCLIPQEMSNADINEELELSDASGDEDTSNTHVNSSQLGHKQPTDSLQPSWKPIKTNMFLHRNRKNQPIDEVMVCHCKPPLEGRMGCRDECLNRMLNIECVKGTCPCGDSCSNQQFQKRKYSKLKCVSSGKKGFGLQLLEDIPKGRFLIEYVGEVLDMPAYEARQREYALKGHKHFYFMTLNGSEVIDACAKGNLSRFINHSCEPNCRTEKWMVNGEVCVGLFALRDIKKGEELTFDYNYVRVFGAAAKKCVCGSARCRGVIGGDPLNDETVVLGDSDDELPEPVTFGENANNKLDHRVSEAQTVKSTSKNDDDEIDHFLVAADMENAQKGESPDSLLVTDEKDDDPAIPFESTDREVSFERSSSETKVEDLLSLDTSKENDVKSEITSRDALEVSIERSSSESNLDHSGLLSFDSSSKVNDVKSEVACRDALDDGPAEKDMKIPKKKSKLRKKLKEFTIAKPKSRSKLPSSSSAVKKGKFRSMQPQIDKKPLVEPQKPKKLVVDNLTGHFEAVEEALNTLLNENKGISKRRDASKGYLMLLCRTAYGGNGKGIQSNRELSIILGALLLTKSRTVLLDIINKNGLQMLHILLKRYRKDFDKTPILRKLLKIFEYLTETKILTLEAILKPSPHGGESLKESILSFTEHENKQVHQIARNFRDRYIPWHARRGNRVERDTERMEFQQTSNFKSPPLQNTHFSNRERRPEVADNSIKQSLGGHRPRVDARNPEGSSASCLSSGTERTRIRKRKSRWDEDDEGKSNIEISPNKQSRKVTDHICHTVHEKQQSIDEDANMDAVADAPPGFPSPDNHQLFPFNPSPQPMETAHQKSVMGQPQERYNSRLPTAFGIPCSVLKKTGTPKSEISESWIVAPAMTFHPYPPLPVYPRVKERIPGSFNQPNFQTFKNPNMVDRRYFKQQKWNNLRSSHPWNPHKYGPAGFNGPRQANVGVGYGGNEANGTYNTGNCENGFYQQPYQ